MSYMDMKHAAERISDKLNEHFDPAQAPLRQVLAIAEEVGEFVGEYRRAGGMARRKGSWDKVKEELADVVITAWVTAHVLGIDLDDEIAKKLDVIFSRGWREE